MNTYTTGPLSWTIKSDDSSAVNRIDCRMRWTSGQWYVDTTIEWKSAPTAPYFYVVTWAAYLEAQVNSANSLGRMANAIKRADLSVPATA
jgi:hypothetical protein